MAKDYRLECIRDSIEMIQLLEEKIGDYNSGALQQYDGHWFTKLFKDVNGNIIAGIGGWTWAKACEVTQFWVDEKLRRQGLGKRLLQAAEEEAIQQGCVSIVIKTFSFQAPDFYLKHGYQLEHVIPDFPQGCSYYTVIKRMA